MLDEIKNQTRGTLQFVKAVDDHHWMASFGIRSVPAVVIVDGDKDPTILVGKEIKRSKIEELIK